MLNTMINPNRLGVMASPQTEKLPALRRTQSAPLALDSYQAPEPARRVPFAQVLQAFVDVVAQAQRPLTDEDHARARKDPVLNDKKVDDAFTLGMKTLQRRARRHRKAGHIGQARAEQVGSFVAFTPTILSYFLLNIAAVSSRWGAQKIAGAPFLRARTEGGVREDVILAALHAWDLQLRTNLDWIFADRDAAVAVSREDLYRVADAAAHTDAALRAYVAEYPEERVRYSSELSSALERVQVSLRNFQSALVAIAAGTASLPSPPAQERIKLPRPAKRHWTAWDRFKP